MQSIPSIDQPSMYLIIFLYKRNLINSATVATSNRFLFPIPKLFYVWKFPHLQVSTKMDSVLSYKHVLKSYVVLLSASQPRSHHKTNSVEYDHKEMLEATAFSIRYNS